MSVTGRQQRSTAEPQGFLREEEALSRLEDPVLETAPALHLPIPEEHSPKTTGPAVTVVSAHDRWLALAGIRLLRIRSAELFREKAGVTAHSSPAEIIFLCRERWTNLATVLAVMPQPVESYLVVRRPSGSDDGAIAFLAAARRSEAREAEYLCRQAWSALKADCVLLGAEANPLREVSLLRPAVVIRGQESDERTVGGTGREPSDSLHGAE